MKYNYFVGELRAIMINGKWRATKRNKSRASRDEWIWLDSVEYDSASEALASYITS